MTLYKVLTLSLVGAQLIVAGCSSRSAPAPVETLYTGKTYQDYEADSLAQAKQYQVQSGKRCIQLLFAPAWMLTSWRVLMTSPNLTPYFRDKCCV